MTFPHFTWIFVGLGRERVGRQFIAAKEQRLDAERVADAPLGGQTENIFKQTRADLRAAA